MKKPGLIGGTGPESTIEYYRQIAYGVQKKTGCFPDLVIESLSVFDVLDYCDRKDYAGLADYLLKGLHCLSEAGADFACLTGITPHIVFDEISKRSPLPVISMIDTACEKTEKLGYHKIALLGTYPTMKGTFFQKPFEQAGIQVITPDEEEMQYIGGIIETQLELGKMIPETKKRLCAIVKRMVKEEGIQAVVLGCTELPMILNEKVLSMPCLDVVKIHTDQLISMILED